MTIALTLVQVGSALHVRGRRVAVVPVVLSRSVTVAQSYVTVSGQKLRYQNEMVVDDPGAVNVWASEESVVGDEDPSSAA